MRVRTVEVSTAEAADERSALLVAKAGVYVLIRFLLFRYGTRRARRPGVLGHYRR